MKIKNLKLTTQEHDDLKRSCIDFFKANCTYFPVELEELALRPGSLTPIRRPAGYILQQPGAEVAKAYYLKSGTAVLYCIDPFYGKPMVAHVWEAHMLIILYKEFDLRIPNQEYYIEITKDADLVSISNNCVDDSYLRHPAAVEIAKNVIALKHERLMMQMSILLLPSKAERLQAFERLFPSLKGQLPDKFLCGFLGIGQSTLTHAKVY